MACVRKRRGAFEVDHRDQHGIRRIKRFKTRKEADAYLAEAVRLVQSGEYVPPRQAMTFGELAKAFLKSRTVRQLTLEEYSLIVNRGLVPALGADTKLSHLNSYRIEHYRDALRQQNKATGTINLHMTLLSMMCRYAKQHQWMSFDPMARVKRLPKSGEEKRRKLVGNILSADQVRALLAAAAKHSLQAHTLIRLTVETGLRQSEVVGLHWADIDFHAGLLKVQRGARRGIEAEPKTATSVRTVALTPKLQSQLKVWRHSCPKSEFDLVFCDKKGLHHDAQKLRRTMLHGLLKQAGLKQIRFHDLRHTCASLLIMAGRNVKEVQAQLGHASVEMTLNVYSHLLPGGHHGNAAAMQELLADPAPAAPAEIGSTSAANASPAAAANEKPSRRMAQVINFPSKIARAG